MLVNYMFVSWEQRKKHLMPTYISRVNKNLCHLFLLVQ